MAYLFVRLQNKIQIPKITTGDVLRRVARGVLCCEKGGSSKSVKGCDGARGGASQDYSVGKIL